MLFGDGELNLIFWALRLKEKGNIYITYICIQIVTICVVGRMHKMEIISATGEGAE
jgi:hypothetical protein